MRFVGLTIFLGHFDQGKFNWLLKFVDEFNEEQHLMKALEN